LEEPAVEEVFLYCIYSARKERQQKLRRLYELGDCREFEDRTNDLLRSKELSLVDCDRNRLLRKLMQIEIKALEDLTAGNEQRLMGS
jgi:hypothetical protein